VWGDVNSIARAGIRWYGGSDLGDEYSTVVAYSGEGRYEPPDTQERLLGDFLHPARVGSVMEMVNGVTREVGVDAEGWRLERVVSMFVGLEREARERDGPRLDDLA
jgi:hypothetical protein